MIFMFTVPKEKKKRYNKHLILIRFPHKMTNVLVESVIKLRDTSKRK
jgi:hypothetical protein